jgi:transposase
VLTLECAVLCHQDDVWKELVMANPALQPSDQYARVIFSYGREEGYWRCDHMVAQTKKALDIFARNHPNKVGVFLFDNAPSHRKFPEDALDVERMNRNPGGKQAKLRDGVLPDGQPQRMQYPDDHERFAGQPKGVAAVLEERGIATKGKKMDELVKILAQQTDFREQKNILEELVTSHGHICLFLPKFSPELSPIELVWCHAKRMLREDCDYSATTLRARLQSALERIDVDMIRKFYRHCKRYIRGYEEEISGFEIDAWVKEERKENQPGPLKAPARPASGHRTVASNADIEALRG